MKLQILGKGCAKCVALGEHAEAAAKALGLEYELEKVTDLNESHRPECHHRCRGDEHAGAGGGWRSEKRRQSVVDRGSQKAVERLTVEQTLR